MLSFQVVHFTIAKIQNSNQFYILAHTSFIGKSSLKFFHTKCSPTGQYRRVPSIDTLRDQRRYNQDAIVDIANFPDYQDGDGRKYYYKKQILLENQCVIYRNIFHRTDHHGPFEFVVYNNHQAVSLNVKPITGQTIQVTVDVAFRNVSTWRYEYTKNGFTGVGTDFKHTVNSSDFFNTNYHVPIEEAIFDDSTKTEVSLHSYGETHTILKTQIFGGKFQFGILTTHQIVLIEILPRSDSTIQVLANTHFHTFPTLKFKYSAFNIPTDNVGNLKNEDSDNE
jgi:hypothetical protein